VDSYICNSHFVKERIRRFYGKPASVLAPPCLKDEGEIAVSQKRGDDYLVLSALVPYKRIDQAVEAFRGLPERRLVIVGSGPEEKRLKRMAPPNVSFLGRAKHEELKQYYATARALLFPGKEDFGIVPVEAQSLGCPVIAFGEGGVLDTVIHKKTGILYNEQSSEGLRKAILEHEETRYKAADFHKNVRRFTDRAFKKGIVKHVRAFFPDFEPPTPV
jgi:glycosyltransferase involved in cell wall biosynthesis